MSYLLGRSHLCTLRGTVDRGPWSSPPRKSRETASKQVRWLSFRARDSGVDARAIKSPTHICRSFNRIQPAGRFQKSPWTRRRHLSRQAAHA